MLNAATQRRAAALVNGHPVTPVIVRQDGGFLSVTREGVGSYRLTLMPGNGVQVQALLPTLTNQNDLGQSSADFKVQHPSPEVLLIQCHAAPLVLVDCLFSIIVDELPLP